MATERARARCRERVAALCAAPARHWSPADPSDTVAPDCEQVDIQSTGSPIAPTPAVPQVVSAEMDARMLCPSTCRAHSELLLAGARPGRRLVAEGNSGRDGAGAFGMRTRLSRGAEIRLRRLKRPRLTLRITVTAGNMTTTVVRRGLRLSDLGLISPGRTGPGS